MGQYLDDELLINARKPEGELGGELIDLMNINHESLAVWSLEFLDVGKSDSVLDIGCGGGVNVARFLEMTDNRVVGVDYSETAVKRSLLLNSDAVKKGRCSIINASVSQLPFDDNVFDIATAFETVYFWPDFIKDLMEVRRVLKDGGVIFIANETQPRDNDERQKSIVDLLDMKIYSAGEIEDSLRRAGFRDIAVHVKHSRDSFTGDDADWICAVAKK